MPYDRDEERRQEWQEHDRRELEIIRARLKDKINIVDVETLEKLPTSIEEAQEKIENALKYRNR